MKTKLGLIGPACHWFWFHPLLGSLPYQSQWSPTSTRPIEIQVRDAKDLCITCSCGSSLGCKGTFHLWSHGLHEKMFKRSAGFRKLQCKTNIWRVSWGIFYGRGRLLQNCPNKAVGVELIGTGSPLGLANSSIQSCNAKGANMQADFPCLCCKRPWVGWKLASNWPWTGWVRDPF